MSTRSGNVPHVQGIVLAGGQGCRWTAAGGQGHKLLHRLADGRPVALAAAQTLGAVLPDMLAVVDPCNTLLADILRRAGVPVIPPPSAHAGLGDNLAAAVRATADAGGWLVALGDMPFIKPDTIGALVRALQGGHALVAPVHQGRRGHPVGFSARFQADLVSLKGDTGAREVLRRHAHQLVHIEVDDPGVLLDVDAPHDLAYVPAALGADVLPREQGRGQRRPSSCCG